MTGAGEGGAQGQPTRVDTLALMGQAISEGERKYLAAHPGDLVGADRVTQYIKSYFATLAQVDQAEQNKNYQTIMQGLGPKPGPNGVVPTVDDQGKPIPAPDFDTLMRNPQWASAYNSLSVMQQSGVQARLAQIQAAALGRPMHESGDVMEKVAHLIASKEITSKAQLLPYINNGLGPSYYSWAERLLDEQHKVGGVKIDTRVYRQWQNANAIFAGSYLTNADKDGSQSAADQYKIALQNKADELSDKGDIAGLTALFTPGAKGNMVDRNVIMSFYHGPERPGAAGTAAPVTVQGRIGAPSSPGTSANPIEVLDKQSYDALPHGTYYRKADGKTRQKP